MKNIYFITNVTLGYGNTNYISLSKEVLRKDKAKKIKVIEPIDYERDFYDLNIEGLERNVKYLTLGNHIRHSVKNRFLKKLIIKVINFIYYNLLILISFMRSQDVLITAKVIPILGMLRKATKLIFYCTEIFEVEGRRGWGFDMFKDRVDVTITAQENRAKILDSIFIRAKGYIVQNCPYYSVLHCQSKKKNTILYQGRIGNESNAELIINLADTLSSQFVFHLAGPIDEQFKLEIDRLIDEGKVIYHGYLKSQDLSDLRRDIEFGLITWKDSSLNTKYCAPNKLYEYVQSGMVVLSFSNYSMRKFNNRYNVGYTSSNDDDILNITKYINSLNDEKVKEKSRSNYALYESELNYNYQIEGFIESEL